MHQANAPIAKNNISKPVFGFWVYLMTDCVLFASLFATFIVLQNNTFGGPSGQELFSMPYVLAQTMVLLTSSLAVGLGLLAAYNRRQTHAIVWLIVTFLLGAVFLGMELYEFNHLVAEGYSWQRSAFLSAYFTLVGTHGVHITAGLIWLAVLIMNIRQYGLNNRTLQRATLLALFWHFLDIIWIFIFSIVYLLGGN